MLGGCLCAGWLIVCWVVIWVLGGCLGVGWLSRCWVVVRVLGGGLGVWWLFGWWAVAYVLVGCLCGCLGVGWLSVCGLVVLYCIAAVVHKTKTHRGKPKRSNCEKSGIIIDGFKHKRSHSSVG